MVLVSARVIFGILNFEASCNFLKTLVLYEVSVKLFSLISCNN